MLLLVLVVLIGIQKGLDKPITLALIYTCFDSGLPLISGGLSKDLLIDALITLVYFGAFFFLLSRLSHTIFAWLGTLFVGILFWFMPTTLIVGIFA